MNYCFMTYLGTDDFLPGILALNESLIYFNHYPLIVLVCEDVSQAVIDRLGDKSIDYNIVDRVEAPLNETVNGRGFEHMYTKLRIFEMTAWDKVIYLDSDMIVCQNIDTLFIKPHLSAVIAGNLLNPEWCLFNAGLLVIEPDEILFRNLINLIGKLPSYEGDQGLLQMYFSSWPTSPGLHLDQHFNIPVNYIDTYCRLHGFRFQYSRSTLKTDISVIHYWGPDKPWRINPITFRSMPLTKYRQACLLWWDFYLSAQASACVTY